MPLARKIARSYKGLDLEEREAIAFLALCEAATRYDPTRGPFENFARKRVNGAIMDELRRLRQTVSLPETVTEPLEAEAVVLARERLGRLKNLSPRHRDVALDKMAGYAQKDIALDLGVSEGRVSQIVKEIRTALG